MSTTVIDTLVALFKIQPDPSGAQVANQMLDGLINRTEQLRQDQDRLAATFAVAGAAVAYSWWQANTEYESLRNSLDLVTGSAEATARSMQFLEQFARQSPDQLGQLTAAYQMLLAQGIDPTMERMTRFGDAAAAVQTDMATLIDAVAGGVIGNTERLDVLFGRFGFNFSSRAGTLYAQVGDVNERVGSSFAEIAGYVEELGRSRFAGGMVRQAQTMAGGLSMVQDAWSQLMVAVGSGGLREEVQATALTLADLVSEARPAGREIGQYLLIAVRLLNSGLRLLADNGDEARLALIGLAALGQGALFVGLINVLRQIGITGALVAAEAIAVPLAVGLMLGAIMLLVEDFYVWTKGGKSFIGEFVGQFEQAEGPLGDIARFLMDIKEHGGPALQMMLQDLRDIWGAGEIQWQRWTDWLDGLLERIDQIGRRLENALLLPQARRWLADTRESNRQWTEQQQARARNSPGLGDFLGGGLMNAGEVARGTSNVDAQGNVIAGGERLNPLRWAGNAPTYAAARAAIAPVATRAGMPTGPARPGTRVGQQTNNITVQVPDSVASREGMREFLRTEVPAIIEDSLKTAADRAEAELE